MTNQKFLPKKAYSINDAVKYISLNHNISITEADLFEYIQNGDLVASIHIDGRINKIDCINRKELTENEKLRVRSEEIFLQFSKSECNATIQRNEDFEVISIDLRNIYFNITVILNDEFYLDSYFSDNDKIRLYSGEIGRFQNILFNGYFPLSKEIFDKYNVRELILQGYIDELEDIKANTGESFYFYLPFYENRTKVYLDDIYILHQDIIEFLELFSVIEPNNKQDEVQKLKNQIKEKNEEISKFYQDTGTKERISVQQKQLFALLVKKCYSNLDSRNKVFEVINADLKEAGIRNTAIKADTFYKLIDESADFTKVIFPPKKS
ncbi:SlyX protein [Mannheimia varigena]|uniref:SlyX protein n=1 Tax=Mannheimia varigena TaxID=85404 RepID=UPI001BB2939B|nr:SlyX protein [Mannheimia varigena]